MTGEIIVRFRVLITYNLDVILYKKCRKCCKNVSFVRAYSTGVISREKVDGDCLNLCMDFTDVSKEHSFSIIKVETFG